MIRRFNKLYQGKEKFIMTLPDLYQLQTIRKKVLNNKYTFIIDGKEAVEYIQEYNLYDYAKCDRPLENF